MVCYQAYHANITRYPGMSRLPPQMFTRMDEAPDAEFYREPRFVNHIDTATIAALTSFYKDFVPAGSDVLDLMSSWVSHLPTDAAYARVAALGMNEAELQANPQASEHCVHDLNTSPELPYDPGSFDRALIAVSIQYLIQPVEVLSSVAQILREDGAICIAMSHRLFPSKAILAFHRLPPAERIKLVSEYLSMAGFPHVEFVDASPADADPLWLVLGRKAPTP
jgi:SAM-dependent methyltransferase